MPEVDGYEATRLIRAAESDEHVPIIAMTAHSMLGDRERWLAAGMDDYLSKPVRPELLGAVMDRWVAHTNHHAQNPANDHQQLSAGTDPALSDALDQSTISALRDTLTSEMRAQLITTFEGSLPKCLAEIEDALTRGDSVELRRAAHRLKGSSATLGAVRLEQACQALQHTGRDSDAPVDQTQVEDLQTVAAEALAALRGSLI
jgi:two-component system, sensor histidine kinase and response regulator